MKRRDFDSDKESPAVYDWTELKVGIVLPEGVTLDEAKEYIKLVDYLQ